MEFPIHQTVIFGAHIEMVVFINGTVGRYSSLYAVSVANEFIGIEIIHGLLMQSQEVHNLINATWKL